MDIYTINPNDGYHLIRILDRLRKSDVIVQYNGNDYNEIQTIKHATADSTDNPNDLYDLYGEPIKFYFLVQGNSISINVFFEKYRVAYTLQEKNNWKIIDVEAFGDDFYGRMFSTCENIVGIAGVTAIGILAHFCCEHGYDRVIRHKESPSILQAYFHSLLKNQQLNNNIDFKKIVLLSIADILLEETFAETLTEHDLLFLMTL